MKERLAVEFEQTVLNIITFSGEARNKAMDAINEAKYGKFQKAEYKIKEAEDLLVKAHQKQTDLIQLEASGVEIKPSLLLIHGQDHLMNAMIVKDMAVEFIDLYRRMNEE